MTTPMPERRFARAQRGAVALIIAVVLLIGITLIVLFTNRSLMFEQRTSANQYRATHALQVAEAGLEWALAELNTPLNLDTSCASGGTRTFRDNYLDPLANPVKPVYGTTSGAYSSAQPVCARQTTGAWACGCPVGTSTTVGTAACDDAGGACARFQIRFARVQDPARAITCLSGATDCVASAVTVTSTGCTDTHSPCDGTATISQTYKIVSGLATPPGAPVTARGNVVFGSNAFTVTNTDSASNGITIDAGGTVTGFINAGNVISLPGTPSMSSIVENDSSLSGFPDPFGGGPDADAMFRSYFGVSKADFRSLPTTTTLACTSCTDSQIANAYASGARAIWINGSLDMNGNGTFGTVPSPIVVVVTGPVHINGTINVNGLLYSAAAVWDNSGGGTAGVCGAIVSEGNFSSNGSPDATYCADVLGNLRATSGSFVKVPGSWVDF